ncbi:hypothetical protein ACIQCR_05285 [Streptomyces sp. NPDC093249]|uniref:hypothetical protein n=1 Tax=unclassified Streptomyces TaxID=2593676 RepID=UPI00344EB36F
MPDTADSVTTLLAATAQQGPGDTLRIVLLVSIVGGALLAWFLLRGYRTEDPDTTGTTNAPAATEPTAAGKPTDSGKPAGTADDNTERDANA